MTTFRQPPSRHFPVIRVFVSSTFSDLVAERNALAEKVWPELERYCRQRGFTFQAIDLRWGVPSEAGLDHRTMQICFEELRRAQEASPEPNFLLLLGDKYGWRPLPETISESEYARLREHAKSSEEQGTLADWYRRDRNAIPPHHLLRARADSPDGRDYTRVPDDKGCLRDTDAWLAVQEKLWTIVNRAYPVSLLAERFAEGTDDMPASVHFQGSATEQEIWHGALQVQNPRESVVAWFREIDRTGGDPDPSQLKRFLDLRPDQSPEPDAASALATLKQQVEEKLRPDPVLRARCRWARDADGALTGEVTCDHLAPMCETILMRLRALILRQINDYWGSDLSAEDATVGVVRGTKHELDLELRDHRRFAQERGPVDGFVGRDEQVRSIREYLQGSTNRPLLVHGPSGSGKTALLAYVSQQPFLPGTESGGVSPLILIRFIGAHPESSTLRGLMSSLCRELRVYFPIIKPLPDSLQKLIEEFYAQLGHATNRRPIFVFLDALDQLEPADQARECSWLQSPIFPQTGDSPCHARVVASCLSPSPEFPLENEACESFRGLQSRGLLTGEQLGALEEAKASHLLRQWLFDRQRRLTIDQWNQVDADIRASPACRQPLYLQVLQGRLQGWREFDEPTPLPGSLPLLIQETLSRLCQPNEHGSLPAVALGYLVSARYGLSEGELLEILFRDPEMNSQLEKSVKDYGHSLPPEANHYPVAPWARLRSDLRAYLSERAAPGATVLHCYHRQVEQAVRTLFLTDEASCEERHRLIASYFQHLADPRGDKSWAGNEPRPLAELAFHLAVVSQKAYDDLLSDPIYVHFRCSITDIETLVSDYNASKLPGPLCKAIGNYVGASADRLKRYRNMFMYSAPVASGNSMIISAIGKAMGSKRWKQPRIELIPIHDHIEAPESGRPETDRVNLLWSRQLPVATKRCVSPEAGRLFSWVGFGTIEIRNLDEGSDAIGTIKTFHKPVLSLASNGSGSLLGIAFEDGTCEILPIPFAPHGTTVVNSSRRIKYLLPESEDPYIRFSEDSLVYQATDGRVVKFDAETVLIQPPFERGPGGNNPELISWDGNGIATAYAFRLESHDVVGIQYVDGNQKWIPIKRGRISCVEMLQETRLAIGWVEGRVEIHDLNTPTLLCEFRMNGFPRLSKQSDGLWAISTMSWKRIDPGDGTARDVIPPTPMLGSTVVTEANGHRYAVTATTISCWDVDVERRANSNLHSAYTSDDGSGITVIRHTRRDMSVLRLGERTESHRIEPSDVEVLASLDRGGALLMAFPERRAVLMRPTGAPEVLLHVPFGVTAVHAAVPDGFWVADRIGNIGRVGWDGGYREAADTGTHGPFRLATGQRFVVAICNRFRSDPIDTMWAYTDQSQFGGGFSLIGIRDFSVSDGKLLCAAMRQCDECLFVLFWKTPDRKLLLRYGSVHDFLSSAETAAFLDIGVTEEIDRITFSADPNIVFLLSEVGTLFLICLDPLTQVGTISLTRPITWIEKRSIDARGNLVIVNRETIFRVIHRLEEVPL